MTGFVFLVEQIAVGLYILIALAVFVVWRAWSRARHDYRATPYELERDLARYRQANALTALVLLVELSLIVFGLQNVVAPTLRANAGGSAVRVGQVSDGDFTPVVPTPLSDIGLTPVGGIFPTEIRQVLATPTLTPTPVGTILPNFPPAVGCDTPNATLQVPTTGLLVFQPITVVGTAFTEDFVSYKIELNGPSTFNNYAVIIENLQPVPETGTLAQFVPSQYAPGDYRFRLTVFDITNTLRAACEVTIRLSAPIPTETPIPSPTPAAAEAVG